MAEADIVAKETRVTRGTKAEGEVSFQSSENAYTAPSITPETAWKYLTGNIHLRNQVINMQVQVFPGEPEIYVEDAEGEKVDDLSAWIAKQAAEAGVYPSMKVSWLECMGFGCSVKSPGYKFRGGKFEIDEIRDLPAISFRQAPHGLGMIAPPNPLVPGIVWDKKEQRTRVYQSSDDTLAQTELKNVSIIRDPSTPFPAGVAYCLPAYPVIAAIDHANHAADQQVHRVGAPLIFPQVTGIMTPDLKTWGDNFVKKWGKDTGFFLPDGITFPDVKIRESTTAKDRLEMLVHWLEAYFNPTTVLKREGNSIGGSDAGSMRIWNNFIGGTQSWIEEQYEAFLQPLLTANGYDDVYVRIQLKRPELDRSEVVAQQIQVGIAGKSITPEEIRRNLSELNLGEYSDEVAAVLEQTYAQAAPLIPFGNLAGFTRKEERTASAAERKIAAANEASLQAIERILAKGE